MSVRRCLSCLLLALVLLPPVGLAAGKRLALVIGNADYRQLHTLANPAQDARAMANKLKALGFTLIGADGKPSDGPVLDLGQNRFIEAYLNFAEAARGADIALIYYAGHGMQIGGRSYLLPVDVPKQRIRLIQANSVSLDDILQELDGKARLTVAVFDACREIPELDPVVQRAVRGSGLSRSAFRGLARVRSEGRSRLVAYAGAAGQLVADSGEGGHSPYTGLLLDTLGKEPDQPVEQVFQTVAWRFSQRYGGQNPEVLIQGVRPGYFYLAPRPLPPQTMPPSPNAELLYWQSTERCGKPACYRAYLAAYPRGRFAPLARAWLAAQAPARPPAAPEKIPFTVKTSPEGARVRILNIRPRYRDGIELKPGRYRVEVTHPGYRRHLAWVDLDAAHPVYSVELEPLAAAAATPRPVAGRRRPYEPEMIALRGGCFQMGSPASEKDRDSDERQHQVCVKDFEIGRYEVTQAQWRAVMGDNPSYFSGCDRCPVEKVSWNDVQKYIARLNRRTGKTYRLPTEAEWEYAARAGTSTRYWWGNEVGRNHANCGGCGSRWDNQKTAPVGSFPPNPWGLYDTAGNVWEWTCSDWDSSYGGAEQRCSKGDGADRANRGGSWSRYPRNVRSAYRHNDTPGNRYSYLGFRLSRTSN